MKRRLWLMLALGIVAALWLAHAFLPDGSSPHSPTSADPLLRQVERLRSGSAEERRSAARSLALAHPEGGERVVPALVDTLADPDPEVRAVVVVALGELAPVQTMRELARATDLARRRLALLALGRMGKKATSAIPDVLAALQDADARVQLAAALALRRLVRERMDVPPDLGKPGSFAAGWAQIALQDRVSPESRPVVLLLVAGLADEEPLVRDWSASALAELAPRLPAVRQARPALQKAFRDPAAGFAAAQALAVLARTDQGLADFLVAGLADPDAAIRRQSAAALAGMVNRSGAAVVTLRNRAVVEALLPLLGENDETLRLSAVSILGQIGPLATPAVPALLKMLDGADDRRVRVVVVSALGRMGAEPAVLPALLRALVSDDGQVRDSAAATLAQLDRTSLPALIALLASPDARTRHGAALALGGAGFPAQEAIEPLAKALADADVGVRVTAARALWRLDPGRFEQLVSVLIGALAGSDPPTTASAAVGLEEIGPLAVAAVPALRKILNENDTLLHEQAARTLGRIGPLAAPAVPDLVRLVRREREAIRALGAIGPAARQAIPDLVEVLKTRSDLAAALALAQIDRTRAEGLPVLLRHAATASASERREAWLALSRLGPAARDAIPTLLGEQHEGTQALRPFVLAQIGPESVAALKKALGDPRLRQVACEALAALGPAARDAAPALRRLLRDRPTWGQTSRSAPGENGRPGGLPPRTQALAARTLVALGPAALAVLGEALRDPAVTPEVVLALQGRPLVHHLIEPLPYLLRDGTPAVRVAVAEVLAAADATNPEVRETLPTLRSLLENQESTVRVAVALAIARLDPADRTALPLLTELLMSKEGPARAPAARALGKIGMRARVALPELKAACRDPDPQVRAAAIEALGGLGLDRDVNGGGMVPTLIEALEDREETVRRASVQALGVFGPASAQAVPALTRLAQDERAGVRDEAIVALGQIGPAARSALPVLRASLTGRAGRVEWTASGRLVSVARGLWRIDTGRRDRAREVIALLQGPLLADAPGAPDRLALDVLAELGPEAALAVPALCGKLNSPFPQVRRRASEVLAGIGPAAGAAAPSLEYAARDPDEGVRQQAQYALTKISRR
jgi:HEAT repeat protein